MGRYVAPNGVVMEMGDDAARAVGYKPAEEPQKKPVPKRSAKKSDDE